MPGPEFNPRDDEPVDREEYEAWEKEQMPPDKSPPLTPPTGGTATIATKADWRIGLATTPKMRTHYWFRHMGVIRRIHPETQGIRETMDVEIYHGDGETTILNEPSDEWMTA